ncbi:MAG: hypothetical protein WBB01_01400 [Phormidesmis sp.]
MNCLEYRANYATFAQLPLPREIWDTPEWSAWMDHSYDCDECFDWSLAQQVIERGHNPHLFPCIHIAEQVTKTCEQHPNPYDCPDILIVYEPRFDEYSIPIRDSGSSTIRFCPWCGIKLPVPKRDRWFQELESLGYDDPIQQDIPEEYLTDAWHKKDT